MPQLWDCNGSTKPVSGVSSATAWMSGVVDGLDTIASRYWGTGDPSSGAGWGSDQLGRLWYDPGADEYNPTLKEWIRFDSGGTDYGFRPVRVRREFWPDNPPAITMPWSSPQVVDRTWATLSLASLIDTVQDATFQLALAREVEIEVTLTEAGTIGAADSYLELRKKGAASMARRVKCQVTAIPTVATIRLPVDSAEDLEVQLKVAGASPSLAFSLKLVAVAEAEAV